jgi:hypothetical protein
MDFGTNPAQASTARRTKKEETSHGIATVELPNGQRLDGYIILTPKNVAKLGINADKVKEFEDGKKKGTIGLDGGVKLHVQFGERELAVADAVEIAFA